MYVQERIKGYPFILSWYVAIFNVIIGIDLYLY